MLEAKGTDHKSRLQLTTMRKGVVWFDQVSAMPLDTYNVYFQAFLFYIRTQKKCFQEYLFYSFFSLSSFFWCVQGHGFRKELVSMLADLKPRFIRFPGILSDQSSLPVEIIPTDLSLVTTFQWLHQSPKDSGVISSIL